ncbi:MAG: twin-arginine translocation pathway signal, partial [Halieaceae bacterium]|nr:twin-arginine translocation pathway signal [Halieaceae bacterium]
GDEPYIFHFPDGNAGVTRALVRKLVPAALAADGMEAQVLAQLDYSVLDRPGAPVRIRLNSTAVDVRHTPDQSAVDVTYVSGGDSYRVRGKHVVYAGYHALLPSICEGLPEEQVAAINSVTKVPLVYINVALRNWKAFNELGIYHVDVAQPELMHSFGMDFPVSMGGYHYTRSPDEPVVVHGTYVPAVPESGLTAIEQHRQGRRQLYQMSFDDFERKIVEQMNGALGGGGFDAERDIAAITVNRWPHGYAYEYSELFDDLDYGPEYGPHITARQQLGRISIANSDASAYAYVDGAIDAADRAVNEQLKL